MKIQTKDAGIFLVLLFFGIFFVLIFTTREDTYAFLNSAPSFECMDCHIGAEDYVIDIMLEGMPERYEPSKTYELKLIIRSDLESISDIKGGFAAQATAGELLEKDELNTQISGDYLTHTMEGNKYREWTIGWKAPQVADERVDIEVMVVAANGDYSPSMDAVGFETFRTDPE